MQRRLRRVDDPGEVRELRDVRQGEHAVMIRDENDVDFRQIEDPELKKTLSKSGEEEEEEDFIWQCNKIQYIQIDVQFKMTLRGSRVASCRLPATPILV